MPSKFKKKKETETGTIYEYSDKQVEHRHREKAKKVESIKKSIGDLRAKVRKDLDAKDDKVRLTALAVALIDATYERVGNTGSAEDREHFGVTTWKKEHLSFGKGKVTITYVGKSGVKHTKEVTDAKTVSTLKDAVKDAKPGDSIFDCIEGACVAASDVNTYLDPYKITAKDLRGYHANRLMQDRLKELRSQGKTLPTPRKDKDKVLKGEFEKALKDVAADVGHEPATLRTNYLVPALESSFMQDGTVLTKLDEKKTASRIAMAVRVSEKYLKI